MFQKFNNFLIEQEPLILLLLVSGMIPPYRQTFYMYKDILVDEAQELMAKNLVSSFVFRSVVKL
jgi:hypothetical protein